MNEIPDDVQKATRPILSKKILLLHSAACLIVLCIVWEGTYLTKRMYQREKGQAIRDARIAVDAFAQHTIQTVNQVDMLIQSVRITYLRTGSVAETEQFIQGLHFDTSIIEKVFLVNASGAFLIPSDKSATSQNVLDRDYFKFHEATPDDTPFVSAVAKGRVTGRQNFRITRRISHPDGSFAGVVLATVVPHSFTRYHEELEIGPQNVFALVGLHDRKVRARVPELEDNQWDVPIDLPLFDAMKYADAGSFECKSPIDQIHRTFRYKKTGEYPLAVMVGFSDEDVQNRIEEQRNWLTRLEMVIIAFILVVALMVHRMANANATLKIEIAERKRIEADREHLIKELQNTLATVRQLEGILPICSFCKKIRNDKGYWDQVDAYISRNSEAKFSHGVCPECFAKHYPEYVENSSEPETPNHNKSNT